MGKAKNPFMLHSSNVKIGKEIGRGRFFEAHEATIREKSGGKRRLVAKFPRRDTWFLSPDLKIERGQKILTDLRKLGLPVPKFSKADYRKKSKTYLHVFAPDFEKKYGKLIPVHDSSWERKGGMPQPAFLKQLRLRKDRTLIDELSSDLAKIHSGGYTVFVVDFWHFYKKGNTYGRVIFDVGELYKLGKSEVPTMRSLNIQNTFVDFLNNLGSEEFNYFLERYMLHTPSRPLAEWLYDNFAEKPHGYYAANAPRRRERWKEEALRKAGK